MNHNVVIFIIVSMFHQYYYIPVNSNITIFKDEDHWLRIDSSFSLSYFHKTLQSYTKYKIACLFAQIYMNIII